jgi:hypothetical protein
MNGVSRIQEFLFERLQFRTTEAEDRAPVVLCSAENFSSRSWGDDGNIVAALSLGDGLSRVSSEGGTPMPVTELRTGELKQRWAQVLPGSQAVLFTAYTGGGDEGASVDILAFKTHKRKTLIRGGVMGRYLAAPDGRAYLIYLHKSTLLAVDFDPGRLAVTGAAEPILGDVGTLVPTESRGLRFSPHRNIRLRQWQRRARAIDLLAGPYRQNGAVTSSAGIL